MRTTPSLKKLLIAAAVTLAPAGVALAAQDCTGDAHARYSLIIGTDGPAYQCVSETPGAGAQGPSGPVIAADMACGRDPFDGYLRGFGAGGPRQLCDTSLSGTGAYGPAGPAMADSWSARTNPFLGYQRTFIGD